MNLTLILNRKAGTLRGQDARAVAEELAEIFRAHGHKVKAEVRSGRATVAAIARICKEQSCDAIVVGGGDGPISAAAAAGRGKRVDARHPAARHDEPFRPLARHPARDACRRRGARRRERVAVDIGEVNGRFFVHHVTLGLHPRMIRIRERLNYGSRLGKIWASVQAWWIVLRQPPASRPLVSPDGESLERRTAAILVSNNPLGDGHLPYADDLRQGKLGLMSRPRGAGRIFCS